MLLLLLLFVFFVVCFRCCWLLACPYFCFCCCCCCCLIAQRLIIFINYIEQFISVNFDFRIHLTAVDFFFLFWMKRYNYGKIKTKLIDHHLTGEKNVYKYLQNDQRLASVVHDIWKPAQASRCLHVTIKASKNVQGAYTVTKGNMYSARRTG